jgi:hypothetical protein
MSDVAHHGIYKRFDSSIQAGSFPCSTAKRSGCTCGNARLRRYSRSFSPTLVAFCHLLRVSA